MPLYKPVSDEEMYISYFDKSLLDRNKDGKYIFLIFEQSLTDWIDENEREHKSQFSSCQINRT